MTHRFNVGDRVRVLEQVQGGTNRTPFYIRGKKGVVVYYFGLAGNPRDLSYGGTGEPKIPLYGVSFHMAHLYDDDPDFVRDHLIVDVWEDWLEPVTPERVQGQPIDRREHEPSFHERRLTAIQGFLIGKGFINTDEQRRLVVERGFQKDGTPHPMVDPP